MLALSTPHLVYFAWSDHPEPASVLPRLGLPVASRVDEGRHGDDEGWVRRLGVVVDRVRDGDARVTGEAADDLNRRPIEDTGNQQCCDLVE